VAGLFHAQYEKSLLLFVMQCRGGSEPYSDDRGGGRGRGRGNNTRWREGRLAVHRLILLIMAALWNRAGHYIFFALWFLSSSLFLFFPRLISTVGDWMSAILTHMVWP